ncbi:FAD-dependent oxidoreductase [Ruminococcus sp. OA3]|uniref:NAD(P)-binding protein n=1 Tax=Ruminococcus sp. OA3 TaxID=2914164 RepID=UPI001F069CC4|nr:NAD(P)-binding protein [Ruminococcus sp. OA3]MCH1983862.1 FAD-dependent oxidoreductase [Ruminococcus sp. OA3]
MSRLMIATKSTAQTTVEGLYRELERRIVASPPGLCPVDMALVFLKMCHAQTCGKCVPCRIGLGQLGRLLEQVLDGEASMDDIPLIEKTARTIMDTADCAIGYTAAEMVVKGISGFRDDYEEHIRHGKCLASLEQPVPCVALCPARVDIPGYIALVAEGRHADAVRLIRKDNPFPTACAFVCEHPCEARCRRNIVDTSVNIRGIKLAAVDNAGHVPAPECGESTGKRVAIIGGGPSGLSAAYYLQLMGHQTTVFEMHRHLGGMLYYGIPSYRLPRERLDEDINTILSTGVEVKLGTFVGDGEDQVTISDLREMYDAVYISIGAHTDKKVGLEGEDAEGVISAVEMLGTLADGGSMDFTGKRVVVIGGGNVAMDVTRSAIRLGAETVTVVYRRRQVDMTALPEEVRSAVAEGAQIMELHAPVRIDTDEHNKVSALVAQPKLIGLIGKDGRPKPSRSEKPEVSIPCDVVIVAIGQGIETDHFEERGIAIKHGVIAAESWSAVENAPGVFAGGDCVTGPATAIRAIAAGKVAAANIDSYLGYDHTISTDVEIPAPKTKDYFPCGRINVREREPAERKRDFEEVECSLTQEEIRQESARCLRCDHFGFGILKGGRETRW